MARLAATLAAVLVFTPGSALAATITVNTTDDGASSDCTLRDAITAANDNTATGNCAAGDPGPTVDVIDITATGTINAGSQLPLITEDANIQGPGATDLDVQRSNTGSLYRLFNVTTGTVTISDLTISNGSETSNGGGIANNGTLTLDGVNVTGNSVSDTSSTASSILSVAGGGIYNGGTLALRESTVSSNTTTATNTGTGASRATARGAGIANDGTMTIEDSTVSGNTATGTDTSTDPNTRAFAYGGIDNGGTLTVTRSTVSGNSAAAMETGAASNTGSAAGAGIFLFGPTTVELTTITGNSATASGGSFHIATGGLYNGGGAGTLSASSDTISGNSGATAANVFADTADPFQNTIVSDPSGPRNCVQAVTSNGYNLEDGSSPGSCGFTQPTDLHADPDLGSLADNGGPTRTLALEVGGPAVDAGLSAGETTDQRGKSRPFGFPSISNAAGGDGSDIGAFELHGSEVAIKAKLTASRHKVRKGKKVKLKVKVTPCRIAAGDTVKLYRGSRKVGKKHLSSNCKATFRKRVKHKSKFKAKVPAGTEHKGDTSNKVTVRVRR